MSDDLELLPDREREHARSRDRKVRGPKVVVDNPGMKKLSVQLGQKRRQAAAARARSRVGARRRTAR